MREKRAKINMRDKLFKIISKIMDVPVEHITEDSSPDTVKKWDSLQHMNLILALEEEFDVQFSDDEVVEMLSVELILLTLKGKGGNIGMGVCTCLR